MPTSSDSNLSEKIAHERNKIKHMLKGLTKSLKHTAEKTGNVQCEGRHKHKKRRKAKQNFNDIEARVMALNARRQSMRNCNGVYNRDYGVYNLVNTRDKYDKDHGVFDQTNLLQREDLHVVKRNLETLYENQNQNHRY